MTKRLLSLLLALSMVLSIVSPTIAVGMENSARILISEAKETQKNQFDDVEENTWYYDAVMYTLQKNIFSGTGLKEFSPKENMTRGMFVTVIGRIAEINPADYSGKSSFDDVSLDDYYSPYIVWATEKGIIKGISKTLFNPSSFVSREQMAELTVRFFDAYGIDYPKEIVKNNPKDLDNVADWAKKSVMKLWSCGMILGNNGNFLPKSNSTRAEVAVFSMRSHDALKKWIIETSLKAEETKKLEETKTLEETKKPEQPQEPDDNENPNASSYKVSFNTNGASPIATIYVEKGKMVSDIPSPKKENAIFLGWYTDDTLKGRFYAENPINNNLTLYARYGEVATQEKFADESFSLVDQEPSLSFNVSCTENLGIEYVKANISLEIIDNTEYVNLEVTGGNGEFIVKAEGGFNEGSSYKLTLNDATLNFTNKSSSFRNCTFTISQEEVIDISLKDDLIYIESNEISDIKTDGKSVQYLSIALLGNIEDIQEAQKNGTTNKKITGTFNYENANKLKSADVLCVYDKIKPFNRNTTDDYSNDSISYVKVTGINGTTISFQNVNPEEVIFLPDTLPLKEIDLSSYDATGSFTENTSELNFSMFTEIGLDGSTTVDKGDFIIISETDNDVVYGKVTRVTENGGITTVLFTLTTMEEIQDTTMDYYTKEDLSGEKMLEGIDVAAMEKQIANQAIDSGFAEQALVYLASIATRTEGFQDISGAEDFIIMDDGGNIIKPGDIALLGSNFGYKKDDIKVKVSLDKYSEHFGGKGLTCKVEVSGEITVDVNDESEIKILLSAAFQEEIKVSMSAKGKAVWYKTSWWPHVPCIGDYQMNASVDLYNYTGVSLKATVSSKEKEAEGNSKFSDITEQLKELMASEDEEEITAGVQNLFEAYGEMLANETDYIEIVNKNIIDAETSDPFHILCVAFKVNFVVRANINLVLGSNFSYECGNRYSFWFKIREKSSGSATMQLIDEKYAFQFYAMGELGLRVGIQLEFAVGLFSTKLDSVGIVTEVGPYVELFGYFFYELTSVKAPDADVKIDSKMSGALYVEFGVYLIISFKAQLGDGKLEYNPTLYEKRWPILYVGEKINVYDFSYEKISNDEKMIIKDITTYTLPESLRNMSCLNLMEGSLFQDIYETDRFYYNLSNPNFALNDNKITVTVPTNVRYMECDLDITWKNAKLTFSKDDLRRTIHLVWTNLTEMEMTQKYDIYIKVNGKNIWSKTVNKGETPLLPTSEEILKLIGYNKYMDGTTNLKYSAYTGYDSVAVPAQGNKTYKFGVTEKEYILKVKDVENQDGTKTNKVFTAKVGEKFDLSSLEQSGTRIKGSTVEDTIYTNYLTTESNEIEGQRGKMVDSVIDSIFAKELLAETYTYTAKYEDNSCLVVYKFNTSDKESIDPVSEKVERATIPSFDYSEYLLTKGEGYMVKEWDKTIGKVMVNTTFTATLTKAEGEKLTISFDSKGGSHVPPMNRYQGGSITAPTEPTKIGYIFDGWYSDEELQNRYSFDKMPNESFTLYAKWNAAEYTVTFDLNGGNGDDRNKKVVYGEKYGELPIPTKDGSGFIGWYTEAESGDEITAETIVSMSMDHRLFAHWTIKENISGINTEVQIFDYDNIEKIFEIKGTDFTGFTVKYKKSGDNDWYDNAVNAGKYAVQITRPEDDIYSAYELVLTDALIIEKASRTINAPMGGTSYYSTISVEPVRDFIGDGEVEYAVSSTVSIPESGWTESLSIVNLYRAGDYYLFSRVREGSNYLAATSVASSTTVKVESSLALIDRNWIVGVKTGTASGAGTAAKVEIVFNYIGSGYEIIWHNLDSGSNDHENGDYRDYAVTERKDPWILSGFDIGNDGKGTGSKWQCSYVNLKIGNFGPVKIDVNRWFDKEYEFYSTGNSFKRNITSLGEFDEWGGTYDISNDGTDNISYEFDGNITDQYGTYNVYEHYDAPVIQVKISQAGYSDCYSNKANSFSIDKSAIYEKMVENNEKTLEFTITMKFDPRSTNTVEFTKTVVINIP